MGSRKFEYDSNPDEADYNNQDFRDQFTIYSDEELLRRNTFYLFKDEKTKSHVIGMLILEHEERFELGLPNGEIRFCEKEYYAYANPEREEIIDFIFQTRKHRLSELFV